MRYTDHHQEELRKRREERAQRDYDARRHEDNPDQQSSSETSKFWDQMIAKDAPRPGLWPWACANETRFMFCFLFVAVAGITIILFVLRYLSCADVVQLPIDDMTFLWLANILLAITIAMLVLVEVAYGISGKRKQ